MIDGLFELSEVQTQAYLDDKIQIHQLIEWALEQIGPAHLINTTFSISEEFIRNISRLVAKEQILSAVELSDIRASKKTYKLNSFITSTFDEVYLTENHSKIALLYNEEYVVSIISSQNQTRGNRYEAGIISTDPLIFDFLKTRLENIMNNNSMVFSKKEITTPRPQPKYKQLMKKEVNTDQAEEPVLVPEVIETIDLTTYEEDETLLSYSAEDVKTISKCANLLMPPSDIAAIIDKDPDLFRQDLTNKFCFVAKAYYKAKALRTLALREQEIKMAAAGSPAAIENLTAFEQLMTANEL